MSELNKKNINYGGLNRFLQNLRSHDLSGLATEEYVDDAIGSIEIPEYTAGNNISINSNNVISSTYTIPTAAANTLGGIKVGNNMSINSNGELNPKQYNIVSDESIIIGANKNAVENNYGRRDIILTTDNNNNVGWENTIETYSYTAGTTTLIYVSGNYGSNSFSTPAYIKYDGEIRRALSKNGKNIVLDRGFTSSFNDKTIMFLRNTTTISYGYGQCVAIGDGLELLNSNEIALGNHNKSHKANTTWGDAGNTKLSIGISENGSSYVGKYDGENAIELMQNGDMYIKGVGGYDGKHIKTETGYESTRTIQDELRVIEGSATLVYDASMNVTGISGVTFSGYTESDLLNMNDAKVRMVFDMSMGGSSNGTLTQSGFLSKFVMSMGGVDVPMLMLTFGFMDMATQTFKTLYMVYDTSLPTPAWSVQL